MNRALTKAERLLQLEALLISHTEGLRKAQIAARLGVARSMAGCYVTALTDLVPIVEEDDGRLWIDRSRYLPPAADLYIEAYTSDAWGIWGRSAKKPVSIVLLFSSSVVERVQETVYHKS